MDCLVTFTRTNFCASLSYFKKEIMKKGDIFEPLYILSDFRTC